MQVRTAVAAPNAVDREDATGLRIFCRFGRGADPRDSNREQTLRTIGAIQQTDAEHVIRPRGRSATVAARALKSHRVRGSDLRLVVIESLTQLEIRCNEQRLATAAAQQARTFIRA